MTIAEANSEELLLSCCLLDGADSLAAALGAGATPGWFATPACRVLFARLTTMLASGKSMDIGVLVQEMTTAGEMQSVGGYPGLARLAGLAPTTAGFRDYLRRVRDQHVLRNVEKEARNLVAACADAKNQPLTEILDGPIARLLALSAHSDAEREPTWREVVEEAKKAAETLIESKKRPPESIITTPWESMDEIFEPLQRGQLVVIGARPSVGKSSLARQLLVHAVRQKHKAYLDTLEVKPVQVPLQIAAMLSSVGVRELGRAHPKNQAEFKSELEHLASLGVTISNRDRSLARIVARLKGLAVNGGIDLAIIDHGGYIDDIINATKDEKVATIGRVTKTLKNLAVELNIPVVLLWQLNRLSANESNREPRVSDLRDAGSLEEDADKIWLIHRPSEDPITGQAQSEYSPKDEVPRFFQNVIQAKGRDDGTALMSFYFVRRTATFVPIERKKTAPVPVGTLL